MTTLVCNNDLALVTPLGDYETRRNYLDYMFSVLPGAGKSTIKPPVIIKTIAARVQRAARSVRSSVRQTFAARKAAKAADDGGGES